MLMRRIALMAALAIVCVAPCQAAADRAVPWPTQGWEAARPEDQGMDGSLSGRIESYIAEKLPKTTSIVVVRHGYLVYEKYYQGNQDTLRDTYSVTKSFTSALVGIAIANQQLPGLDSKAITLLKDVDTSRSRPFARMVTIRHLLTMTSGIAKAMGGGIGAFEIEELLKSSLQGQPGETFSYNEANPNLLSMIVTDNTGMALADYAKQHLFGPLGILSYKWAASMGYTIGGDGLKLTTRDLAKLGYLYLKGGHWEGMQVVPARWIAESTAGQTLTGDPMARGLREYGYFWWLLSFGRYPAYTAYGFLGQIICVVPELGLVVAATGEHENSGDRLDIIRDVIVPAAVAD
jgi:CubicO group peptidase (beta-lactamase class C family)